MPSSYLSLFCVCSFSEMYLKHFTSWHPCFNPHPNAVGYTSPSKAPYMTSKSRLFVKKSKSFSFAVFGKSNKTSRTEDINSNLQRTHLKKALHEKVSPIKNDQDQAVSFLWPHTPSMGKDERSRISCTDTLISYITLKWGYFCSRRFFLLFLFSVSDIKSQITTTILHTHKKHHKS